jgi:hypothetical protein
VKQKTYLGGTPCKNHLGEKVLIAHSSVNVPHRTLMGHKSDEYQEYEEKLCEHKICGQASTSPKFLQKCDMALPVEKPYDNKLCDDTFR